MASAIGEGWQWARGGVRLLVQSPNRTENHMNHCSRLTREQRYTLEAMKRNGRVPKRNRRCHWEAPIDGEPRIPLRRNDFRELLFRGGPKARPI